MKAMILAAGEGVRLRPLTLKTPKALLPVADRPLILHLLAWFRRHGISDVAINVHHLADAVIDTLRDGADLGMSLTYSHEETLLGTAGGVKRMADFLEGPFVVHYGDVLTDFDLSEMARFHREAGAIATLAVVNMAEPRVAGVVEMDDSGRITAFSEKPDGRSNSPRLENGGTYLLEKEALQFVPPGEASDFGQDVFPELLRRNLPLYGYLLKEDDYLIDIGSLEKYRQAGEDVRAGRVRLYLD